MTVTVTKTLTETERLAFEQSRAARLAALAAFERQRARIARLERRLERERATLDGLDAQAQRAEMDRVAALHTIMGERARREGFDAPAQFEVRPVAGHLSFVWTEAPKSAPTPPATPTPSAPQDAPPDKK